LLACLFACFVSQSFHHTGNQYITVSHDGPHNHKAPTLLIPMKDYSHTQQDQRLVSSPFTLKSQEIAPAATKRIPSPH